MTTKSASGCKRNDFQRMLKQISTVNAFNQPPHHFQSAVGVTIMSFSKQFIDTSRACVRAGIIALAAFPALADVMVAKGSGTNELRLYGTPCTHAQTLERLKSEWHDKFRKAEADYNGRLVQGCHVHIEEHGVHFVLLEGDDGFALPVEAFTVERGV